MRLHINLKDKIGMKKLIFSIATISMLSFTATAQITLEHTFKGNVTASWNYAYNVIDYYIYVNTATNQVRFYNEDYSLYKSVTITPPSNYSFIGAYTFSKNMITTDDKISFCVVFGNSTLPDQNLRYNLKMYDEDGIMIKDFGYMAVAGSPTFYEVSKKYKLLLLRYIYENSTIGYETEIYSVPGIPPKLPISPTITTTTLPDGTTGITYTQTLTATGTEPITWELSNGNLPIGLTISSEGVISGTPTVSELSNFTIKAINEAGIDTKELSIFIDEETGITMLQIAELKVFPNPTNGKLIIDGGNITQNRIIFYDMAGGEVLNQNINGKTEVNISHLQKGTYIVAIISEREVIGHFKIVKQ